VPRLSDQLESLRDVLEHTATWEQTKSLSGAAFAEPTDAFLAWLIDMTDVKEPVQDIENREHFAWCALHAWRGWNAGYRYARAEC
jgi:hypothetical protein